MDNIDEFIDHYEVLGLKSDATDMEISKAFKLLCVKYHPDKKNGNSDKFEQINKSYSILKNSNLRKKYDAIFSTMIKNNCNFINLRNGYQNYTSSQNLNATPAESNEAINFINTKSVTEDYLKRHYNEEIDKEIKQKIQDLKLIREHDDLENIPEKIFNDDEVFDLDKFNREFESETNLNIDIDFNENIDNADNLYRKSKTLCVNDFNLDCTNDVLNMSNISSFNNFSQVYKPTSFLDQFTLITPNVSKYDNKKFDQKIDDNYINKILRDRQNMVENITYENTINNGITNNLSNDLGITTSELELFLDFKK